MLTLNIYKVSEQEPSVGGKHLIRVDTVSRKAYRFKSVRVIPRDPEEDPIHPDDKDIVHPTLLWHDEEMHMDDLWADISTMKEHHEEVDHHIP